MVRFLILFLCLLFFNFIYLIVSPKFEEIREEGFVNTVSKEKTINTVQTHREQRRLEAEKVLDQY